MKHHLRIIAAAAMLAGGMLLGRHLKDARLDHQPASSKDTAAASSPRSRADQKPTVRHPERPMNLAAIRARLSSVWNEQVGSQELERLSAGQLRDFITELVARAGNEEKDGRKMASDLMRSAAMELYKREGLTAADWVVEKIPSGAARKSLLTAIVSQAAEAHPESAKPWIIKLETDYGRDAVMTSIFNAVRGSTERGAADLVNLVDLFGKDYLSRTMIPMGECPSDFDFATFYGGVVGKVNLRAAVETWATRDPDAAWQAVKGDLQARGKPAAQYFESIVLGMTSKDGEAAAMAWGVNALKELPEDQRELCLSGLYTRYSTPQSIAATARSLPPESREAFASSLVAMTAGDPRVSGVLEALDRDQLLRVLEGIASKNRDALTGTDGSYYPKTLRQMFRDTETKFSLTDQEKSRIGL